MVEYLIAMFAQAIPVSVMGLIGAYPLRKHRYPAALVGMVLGGAPSLIMAGSDPIRTFFAALVGALYGLGLFNLSRWRNGDPKSDRTNSHHSDFFNEMSAMAEGRNSTENANDDSLHSTNVDDSIYEEIAIEIET